METLKKEIHTQIEILQEMINLSKQAEKVEKQRKLVNMLLKEYLKDL